MNESARLSDREVTDMLRRRSARPAPHGLASAILASLAGERAGHPARTTGRSAKRPLLLLAAAALLLGGGVLAGGSGALRLWSTVPPDPRSAFVGTWVSTSDADGGTQTMTVAVGRGDAVDVVVTDTIASVCSGGPSRMTGTGRVAGDRIVIPSPDYRCDDGSEPHLLNGDSTPMNESLRNLTYLRDPETDTLSVSGGDIWLREGARLPSMAPETPRTDGPSSGGMWPQATLEEVRAAQARADAGDLASAWQMGAQVDPNTSQVDIGLVDRFLREVLGWESYTSNEFVEGGVFSDWEGAADGWAEGTVTGLQYIRCEPGRANPRYPGESCAPTLDDLHYESVSIDIAQLDRQGREGIWVVSGWRQQTPFAQADPATVEAQATGSLEAFLAARVAGKSAEGSVEVAGASEVPLLYATTTGARYDRFEIARTDGPWWPTGGMRFAVRLFADAGATTVEQEVTSDGHGRLWLDAYSTTENGHPIAMLRVSDDGAVSVTAPSDWKSWLPGRDPTAWFGMVWRNDMPSSEAGEEIELVDPVAYDRWCWGRDLPEGAGAIAQVIQAEPDLETTAPVGAQIGGLEAVSMDVALVPGGSLCLKGEIEIARWIHVLRPDSGLRLRLYLVDLPAGMPVRTVAITVVAPEERFEAYLAETAPIIQSIQFHPGAGAAGPSQTP